MKRALPWLLLAGCLTVDPAPAVVTRPDPGLASAPTRPATPAEAPVGWSELPPSLAVDPHRVPIPPLELKVLKPVKTQLPNGLTVYSMEDHAAPLVSVRALIWEGGFDDPPLKLGLADLTTDLAASGGAGALTAEQLCAAYGL